MSEGKENGNREIGELSTKVDSLTAAFLDFREEYRKGRNDDHKWRDLHDGQGTNTTHKEMWSEIGKAKAEAAKANGEVANIKTNASIFAAISGAITSFLSNYGISFFGGPKG